MAGLPNGTEPPDAPAMAAGRGAAALAGTAGQPPAIARDTRPRAVPSLDEWLSRPPRGLGAGPVAVILIEDGAAVRATLDHHRRMGFHRILALSPEPLAPADLPDDPDGRIVNLLMNCRRPQSHVTAVNAVIDAVPAGTWLYYGYNAEFLFYPFAETRSVGEMLAFHAEERRRSMLTYVLDLYAPDLTRFHDAVSLDEARFDRTGYFALGRPDKEGGLKERQYDFHGGLRWRFEEFIPPDRRRIDRIALMRTEPGLRLLADHRLSVEEMNTYASPWHHNLTAAVASFRVAKALARNPASRDRIGSFVWRGSHRFEWTSQQLMDLGLIEPGQWF